MKEKKRAIFPPAVPHRCEIRDNPVKLCHEVSRLSSARVRSANIEGIMSQHGARLVLSAIALEREASQRRIVEITHLRPPTVSVILRKMQDEGMVELFSNPQDKREVRVKLTEYGESVDRNGIEKIKETDALALEGFSESEREALMAMLYRVRQNLLDALCAESKENEE
jgi:DNA-binding MarR family transcriptional regulator